MGGNTLMIDLAIGTRTPKKRILFGDVICL